MRLRERQILKKKEEEDLKILFEKRVPCVFILFNHLYSSLIRT